MKRVLYTAFEDMKNMQGMEFSFSGPCSLELNAAHGLLLLFSYGTRPCSIVADIRVPFACDEIRFKAHRERGYCVKVRRSQSTDDS